eukprot:4484649-Pleurochrysis_carterae.AAC.1
MAREPHINNGLYHRGKRHHVKHSCQSDASSDRVASDIPHISPSAYTAVNAFRDPFGGSRAYLYYYGAKLLLYPTWVLHTFLASKPLTQLAILRYPSDIATESDYIAC